MELVPTSLYRAVPGLLVPALSRAGAVWLLSTISQGGRAGQAQNLMQAGSKSTRAEAGSPAIPWDPFLQPCLRQKCPRGRGAGATMSQQKGDRIRKSCAIAPAMILGAADASLGWAG